MLEIKDLSKLKITKVKSWAIYFDYDGEKYLLHGSSGDYEHSITLYKRIPLDNKGKYNLEVIYGMFTSTDSIYEFLKQGHPKCYKDIDKEYMVKKLTYYGYCCGLYDGYIENLKVMIDNIDKDIKKCQDEINELRQRKRELLEMKEG